MGLVDYDVSSESEGEAEPQSSHPVKKDVITVGSQSSLFVSLPPPIKKTDEIASEEDEADEFLNKKAEVIEKPPKRIRINVPELHSDDDDEEEFEPVPRKEKRAKCGLFSLLPAPKVVPLKSTSFVPNSLQRSTKSATRTTKVSEAPKVSEPTKVIDAPAFQEHKQLPSDSESETEENGYIAPTTFDDQTWNSLFKKKKQIALPKIKKTTVVESEDQVIDSAPEAEKPYKGLDNQAFKELLGSKKNVKNIDLIEIEEAVIHPDREEWLKSLTDPSFEASPEIKEPVNRTSLVKNHIMSLAERALANDKDLQIRWAESRHSRNQTRTKYGF